MEGSFISESQNKVFDEKKELMKQYLLREDINEDSTVIYFTKLFAKNEFMVASENISRMDNYHHSFEKEQKDYNHTSLVKNINLTMKWCKDFEIIKLKDFALIKLGDIILRYNDFKNGFVYMKVIDTKDDYLQPMLSSSTIEMKIKEEVFHLRDVSMDNLLSFLKVLEKK